MDHIRRSMTRIIIIGPDRINLISNALLKLEEERVFDTLDISEPLNE